jgi:hypothetical protein
VRSLRPLGRRWRRYSAAYRNRLSLAEAYDYLGFYAYPVAEHHCTPHGRAPSPNLFLSSVAQRTRSLRFGPLVMVLNLYHPLRAFEEICMVDHLSDDDRFRFFHPDRDRLRWLGRQDSKLCIPNECGNIEKIIPLSPIHIIRWCGNVGVPNMLKLPNAAAVAVQATLWVALSSPWAALADAAPAKTATQSQTTPRLHEGDLVLLTFGRAGVDRQKCLGQLGDLHLV